TMSLCDFPISLSSMLVRVATFLWSLHSSRACSATLSSSTQTRQLCIDLRFQTVEQIATCYPILTENERKLMIEVLATSTFQM
ncbi:hypothetical protein EDB82DRAFT_507760, partial [Fusarium venenatum]|uniref:uncharacterized protein n=1 Tax=Fusarium venenatum TaxID=56646 RepID=UPI001D845751